MKEREAHRLPGGPATRSDGEVHPEYAERLRRLEIESRALDPGAEDRISLRERVSDYADAYMEDLDRRPVYLASDAADYITGQVFNIDGGVMKHL